MNREAIGERLEPLRERMVRLAFQILHNLQDAEDVTQNAFLKVFLHYDQFKSKSRFSTWVGQIVINEALYLRRAKVASPRKAEVGWPENPDFDIALDGVDDQFDVALRAERCLSVARAARTLNPILRGPFLRHHVLEQTVEEISEAYGLGMSSAKTRILRGFRYVRDCVAPAAVNL